MKVVFFRRLTATICFLLCGLTLGAQAQGPTEQEIIEALSLRPEKADDIVGSRSLGDLFTERGVTSEDGEQKPPSINIKVNFEFDSISLETETILTLNTLGRALRSDDLASDRIMIIGHTDAKGTEEYNEELSKNRAAAVVEYLVLTYQLDPALITSDGHGESQLLDPDNPESELNRRVEIRNISEIE